MNTGQERGITFLLPNGEQLQEDVPWQVAGALLGRDPDQLAKPILIHEVRLLDDGFSLAVDEEGGLWRTFLFTPRWFDRYRSSVDRIMSRQDIEQMDSIGASNLLVCFVAAGNDLVARITRKRIEAGLVDFDDAKNGIPEVFSDPEFAGFFAEMFLKGMAPANKSWKQPDIERGVELYDLAVAIQIADDELSWSKAMSQALDQRPDIVPASWGDPQDSLKKAISRNIEQSRFSLKGWRADRDK